MRLCRGIWFRFSLILDSRVLDLDILFFFFGICFRGFFISLLVFRRKIKGLNKVILFFLSFFLKFFKVFVFKKYGRLGRC